MPGKLFQVPWRFLGYCTSAVMFCTPLKSSGVEHGMSHQKMDGAQAAAHLFHI